MDSIFKKWRDSLQKTRETTFGRIATFFGATDIDDQTFDDLEELLIQADVGVQTTLNLVDIAVEKTDELGLTKTSQLEKLIKDELSNLLFDAEEPDFSNKPTVIMVVVLTDPEKPPQSANWLPAIKTWVKQSF